MSIITDIPFSHLTLSKDNSRRTPATAQQNKELKANIKEIGIQQNLVVAPLPDSGMFAVHAGGRRFTAIQELIAEGVFSSDYLVPCLIENDPGRLAEISLSENTCRADMHPVDELEAYTRLQTQHRYTLDQIAAHFGKPKTQIKKTLVLGAVNPLLLQRCRAGEFDPDTLRAYTLTTDHEKQEQVYQQLTRERNHHEYCVRQALSSGTYTSDDRLVKFVGLPAYKKAGGTTSSDLWGSATYLHDTAIIDQLVQEKVESLKSELGVWGWIEFKDKDRPWEYRDLMCVKGEVKGAPKKLTAELQAAITKLAEVDKEIDAANDKDDWETVDILEQQQSDLHEQIEKLEDRLDGYREFTPEQMAQSGVIIAIDPKGQAVLYKGCLKEKPKSSRVSGDPDSGSDSPAEENTMLSQALVQDFHKHRADILRCAFEDHRLANDLGRFQICADVLSGRSGRVDVFAISVQNIVSDTVKGSRTDQQAGRNAEGLFLDGKDNNWIDLLEDDDWLPAVEVFVKQPEGDKQAQFAAAIGRSIKPTSSTIELYDRVLGKWPVSTITSLWRPTVENYFGAINKTQCLQVSPQILGDDEDGFISRLPKRAIAIRLAEACQPGGRAEHWLPEQLVPVSPDPIDEPMEQSKAA